MIIIITNVLIIRNILKMAIQIISFKTRYFQHFKEEIFENLFIALLFVLEIQLN